MQITPEVLSQLSADKKVELFDWLISKIAVINPDYWENNATMVFPTFYFCFMEESELADSSTIMLNAHQADLEFPATYKNQQAWLNKCKEIQDEVAKKFKGDAD